MSYMQNNRQLFMQVDEYKDGQQIDIYKDEYIVGTSKDRQIDR